MEKLLFWWPVALIVIWLVAIGGWVTNIVKLLGADAIDTTEIVRIVGIFVAPLGAVMGFI